MLQEKILIESIDRLIESNYSYDMVEIWTLQGNLIFQGILNDFRLQTEGIYIVRLNKQQNSFVMMFSN